MSGDICDVCGRSPTAGVACSALGPVSFAYCEECAQKGAEPVGMVNMTDDMVGGDWTEALLSGVSVFQDGSYVTLREYLKGRTP